MTTAAPPRPPAPVVALTPDDLLQMPDGGKGYELIDGRLREKVMSFRSSSVGTLVSYWFQDYNRKVAPVWICGSDGGFQCFASHPGRVRRPDVAVIAHHRMTAEEYADEGFTRIVPDLVVEVVSPTNTAEDVDEKRIDWLRAGVREVWVLFPKTEQLYAFRSEGGYALLTGADTLTSPILPGFSVSVAELFRVPTPPAQSPPAGGE